MPKRTVIAHIWRGFWYLPHVGAHPGWSLAIFLQCIAFGVSAQSRGLIEAFVAFFAMFVLTTVLMAVGAFDRSTLSDRLDEKI